MAEADRPGFVCPSNHTPSPRLGKVRRLHRDVPWSFPPPTGRSISCGECTCAASHLARYISLWGGEALIEAPGIVLLRGHHDGGGGDSKHVPPQLNGGGESSFSLASWSLMEVVSAAVVAPIIARSAVLQWCGAKKTPTTVVKRLVAPDYHAQRHLLQAISPHDVIMYVCGHFVFQIMASCSIQVSGPCQACATTAMSRTPISNGARIIRTLCKNVEQKNV